jgi:gamma-glutamyltranspeptidase/glutathione hydrolase/leukotriene-C4 hydrolase
LINHKQFDQFRTLLLFDKDWNATFAPKGEILKERELIHRNKLSETLQKIADHGAYEFYNVSADHRHRDCSLLRY